MLHRSLRGRAGRRPAFRAALAAGLGAAALAPAAAHADFGIVPGSFSATTTNDAGAEWLQAGAHVNATTAFMLNTTTDNNGFEVPDENVRDVVVDLPPGALADVTASPLCTPAEFSPPSATECPTETQVGVMTVWYKGYPFLPPTERLQPVFNVVPEKGQVAKLGVRIGRNNVVIIPRVRTDGDYGITATIRNLPGGLQILGTRLTLWGVPADPANDDERFLPGLAGEPGPGDGSGNPLPSTAPRRPFFINASDCASDQVTRIRMRSWQNPDRWVSDSFTSPRPTGCEHLRFSPSANASPSTTATDAATGLTVDLDFAHDPSPDGIASSPLRHAKVTLPEGMTVNPSSARGLTACTDAQMGFGTDDPVRCPNASRIGNVWARTPVLNEGLGGGVYVGSQLSDDPESGRLFRIFLQLENEDRGLRIKLPGNLRVDRSTGRIEASFRNNPQMPVSALRVQLNAGPTASLAMPTTCGTHQVMTEVTSWAGQTQYRPSSFTLPCGAERGFAPSFAAGSLDSGGGASSPFTVRLGRQDGSQYLKDLKIELPTGVLAKLDGVPLCGDAAANAGSCPGESRVGTATIGAGAGDPFFLQGGVYLTGPYKGAPFGLAVVTRAVAGPFDLGTVVVRQALHVDPRDAHVTIASDAFPQIVSGVPLRLRSIVVDMDRPGFMVNPTDCSAKEIKATIGSAEGASVDVTQPFAATGCEKLDVKPNLQMQLTDATQTKDGDHPGLVADLALDAGGANLRRVAVGLPLSLALDVNNAQALCTPEQAQAKDCPAGSVVGTATAVTPLLHEPLSGNVYFVEGRRTTETGAVRRTFPKLWVALRGAIALDVWADTDVDASQRLVTTFASIPDAPISSFRLSLAGGEHGILALNTNVCRGKQIATSAFEGHNGRRATQTNPLTTPCASTAASKAKPKKGKKGKRGGARRAA